MIELHPLRLTFRTDVALTLPRPPGALWRGAIGHRLRQDACITGASTCDGCGVVAHCDYGRLFEPVAPRQGLARRFPNPPRPWVLAPGQAQHIEPGDPLILDVTLMGDGLRCWPALRRALGRLQLGSARPELVDIASRPPAPPAQRPPPELVGYCPSIPPAPASVRVLVDTPLRLQHEGRPIGPEAFNAPAFVGALLRRLDALGAATAASQDAAALLDHTRSQVGLTDVRLQWRRGERTSRRQGQRIPLDGLIGDFCLTGDLEPLWPWLWTGQWTHVGKSAVMGLGRYRLVAL